MTIGETGRGTFVRRAPSRQDRDVIPEPLPRNQIDLSINQPAICDAHAAALQEAFAAISQSVALDAGHGLIGYQPSAGQSHHRAAAVQWLSGLGVLALAEDVVLTGGIQQGVMAAVAASFRPGDVVITEALTNPSFRALASMFSLTVVGARMDEEGMVPDHLDLLADRHKAAGLYVMPSLQNPTGIVMSNRRRAEIAEIAARRRLKVIENGAYDGLLTSPPVPLFMLLQKENLAVFYVTALTKVVCAGLRLGFVVTPPTSGAK